MCYNLNSLKGLYRGLYGGLTIGVIKGHTRSLEYSSHGNQGASHSISWKSSIQEIKSCIRSRFPVLRNRILLEKVGRSGPARGDAARSTWSKESSVSGHKNLKTKRVPIRISGYLQNAFLQTLVTHDSARLSRCVRVRVLDTVARTP